MMSRKLLLTSVARAALALTTLTASTALARADEIRVLSAAALQTVFKQIAGEFERTTGHTLALRYGTIGAIYQRVLDGETADYVIGSTLTMPSLAEAGRIDGESQVVLCRTAIGMVVPNGTPVPLVGSVEDFKRALIDAKRIVYANPVGGGAAGVHIGVVIDKLGLADALRPKTKFGAGGDVFEVSLAAGEGTLGMTQVSEIVAKPGGTYVGPLPASLQNDTVFVGGVPRGAPPSSAVTALVKFLKTPTAIAAIRSRGMQTD